MGSIGGGGSSAATQNRTEIIQSEREQLQEIERRMNLYESLFGETERQMINESYGILNQNLIDPYTEQIDELNNQLVDSEKTIEDLEAQRDQKNKASRYNRNPGYVLNETQRRAIDKEIEQIIGAENKLKSMIDERTSAIRTQQGNSKAEQTEQAQARASGTLKGAAGLAEKTRDVRDERYGIDPNANERSVLEQERELALMLAAAEAGAKNKARTDIDGIFKAKQGALLGADLTDRAAANQLQSASQMFMGRAADSYARADQYGQQADAATMSAIQGIGKMAGTAVGTAYAKTTPDLTGTEKLQAISFGY